MKKKPSVTIMFPFLNDWGTVGSLVSLAIATTMKYTDDWEVIIVNDGSVKTNKEALEMITGIVDRGKQIKIINHEKNRGYGGALRSGFAIASKELIFYTDCDAQYDPRELSLLMEALDSAGDKENIGMINGYKIKRNDPLHRIIAGRVYHYLVKTAFDLPIRDTDCDFRLIKKEVFNPSTGSGRKPVRLFENTGTICTELVKKIDYQGYKIIEVPVHHFWRTSGKSQFFNFKRLYATGNNLLKLWWKLKIKKDYYH
ncbi:hypothetical protein A3D05_03165 [Candidatus Gottesmanbacteria bacterium RIFCSPHIGHO2_02_FULL_40_24]|uniref:Glycosyltransferase 2-like domain-containing protein n=1 Tax=Candidatus Gottesmanbacteria bacterium RIFCSPHIGHO2_01_FULL_40_15 TaxID=1798376 RepID=A0A1F5Z139_9BACT|nr:MAG: hypothetical protein A2777_04745 [Candidatus Gottesmanbacteria bacterium RIFCSPHIGHO2_01_FULL_40_15]OGG17692.1 MAG: hypothetical protein A3D05_03165 [Candidatus Gottesmanbacteria bacterium RIFCSPHIGHO2_02_FULL_40_24]OGG21607.1 MAG: hypothetical protein A3B48_04840 [Candidatus Gottesmanbacteria bacterium RIFCSPLOWO2_01_FULL_40_10]OGG24799.1 MAG: hypothetical protein A3E42_02395 [Candidatus Gottesmanbacteria bacterium RIFCSPHIGHO2_12_FULL_40_13]OGG33081.1 MAG: hypothetical protein A3I80_0